MISPMSPRIRLRMQRVMRVVGCDALDDEVSGGAMAVMVGEVLVVGGEDGVNIVLDVGMVRVVELLVEVVVTLAS